MRDNAFKSIRASFASFERTNLFLERKLAYYVDSEGARIMDKFRGEKFNDLKVLNGYGFGFDEPLGHCEHALEGSTFYCKSQNIEVIPKVHKKNHFHHRPQLGGQSTCIHQSCKEPAEA